MSSELANIFAISRSPTRFPETRFVRYFFQARFVSCVSRWSADLADPVRGSLLANAEPGAGSTKPPLSSVSYRPSASQLAE